MLTAAKVLGGALIAKKILTVAAILLGVSLGILWFARPAERTPTERRERGTMADDLAPAEPASGVPEASATGAASATRRTVHVTVTDEHGSPIRGAEVRAIPEPLVPRGEDPATDGALGRSGAGGRLDLQLPDDHPVFTVVVRAPGRSPVGRRRVRLGAILRLAARPGASLTGVVRRPGGAPVAGALVRWSGSLGRRYLAVTTRTAEDGSYRLDGLPALPRDDSPFVPGGYRVTVSAPKAAPLTVAWRPGQDRLDLWLAHGAIVIGRVIDGETGRPVPAARVLLFTAERRHLGKEEDGFGRQSGLASLIAETESGADGAYRFEYVPAKGFHDVVTSSSGRRGMLLGYVGALAPGYLAGNDEVPVRPDGATIETEIRLWPASTVSGRIIDEHGTPLAGVRVWSLAPDRFGGWLPARLPGVPPGVVRTDAGGRYRLEAVSALRERPAPLTILAATDATLRASGDVARHEVEVRAGEPTEVPDIVLGRPILAIVEVVDADGRPVWGATVELLTFRPLRATDRTGVARCVFTTEPGPVRLVVRAIGHAPEATPWMTPSRDDPPRTRLILLPGRRLAGRVVHADGTPAVGVRVDILSPTIPAEVMFPPGRPPLGYLEPVPEGSPGIATYGIGPTRSDGSFTIDSLPAGPYRVRAVTLAADGGRLETFAFHEVGGGDLVLRLPPGSEEGPRGILVGTVADGTTGKPIVGFDVRVETPDGAESRVRRPGPGRFRIEAVPPGEARVTVSARGYESATRTVRVDRGELRIDFELSRGGGVSGRLRPAESGIVLRDAVVSLQPTDGVSEYPALHAFLHADGTFEIRGVARGRWRLLVDPAMALAGHPGLAPEEATVVEMGEAGDRIDLDVRVVRTWPILVRITAGGLAGDRIVVRDARGDVREVVRFHGNGRDHWPRLPAGRGRVDLVRANTVVASDRVDVVPGVRPTIELDAR